MSQKKLFRVYSWNVNGYRSVMGKGYFEWLKKARADVVGLQETRVHPEQLKPEQLKPPRWRTHFAPAERKGYSGVGLFSRKAPDELQTSLMRGPDDEEGRSFDVEGRVQIARFGALTIANVYFPNGSGKDRDHSRVPYKLAFYRRLFDVLEDRRRDEPVIVMGDFNTAHEPIDLARPSGNKKTSGFLPVERAELERWLKSGWTDSFRVRHPDLAGQYTWWSNRIGVREKNVGWRIDYCLTSPAAEAHVLAAKIHPKVLGSDHCPISLDLHPDVLG